MAADVVVEEVPKFTRRYGDYVLEGSNNTIIIMGTDRAKAGPAGLGDGNGHVGGPSKGAGTATVHIIAGRKGKDPDMKDDSSFLYLSKKTKADTNLAITAVAGVSTDDKPSAILKSDVIRIIGRKDIKICANDDEKHYLFMNGSKIKIEFNTDATVEIVDKKITVKMGSDTIVMDDKKAVVTVKDTIVTMDGSMVKVEAKSVTIDAPETKITGKVEIIGDVTMKAKLDVTGASTVKATLDVTGALGCDATITGATDVVGGGKSLKGHKHSAGSLKDSAGTTAGAVTGDTGAPA